MTKKEIEKVRLEAVTELFGVLLILDYSIGDLEIFRDDTRETVKYATKEIANAKKKFNKLKAKYEAITGNTYKRRK